MIGIKIADGTYIPILDESEEEKKKVILTTVRDDQPSVQIDVYRGSGEAMEGAQYLDSLKIDNIPESLKGEPEIELIMCVEGEKLIATVRDLNGENEKSFALGLDPQPEPFSYAAEPDFDLSGSGFEEENEDAPSSYAPMNGQSASIHEEEKNHKPLLVLALIALLVAAGVLCWYFLFRNEEGNDAAASQPAPPAVAVPAKPVQPKPAAPVPAAPAPTPAPQPAAPAIPAQNAAPAEPAKPAETKAPGTGVWYSIVKGDNLWNLSKSFYRTPWQYKKIAAENDIRNPDLIFRGARIYIPDVETDRNKKQ